MLNEIICTVLGALHKNAQEFLFSFEKLKGNIVSAEGNNATRFY